MEKQDNYWADWRKCPKCGKIWPWTSITSNLKCYSCSIAIYLQVIAELLALIEHETDLPKCAANGVFDSTGQLDEGIVKASEILFRAAGVLNGKI